MAEARRRGEMIESEDAPRGCCPLIEACKRAKIAPAVSFHVLRHTHGSLLAMEGVPLAVIAKQLGHADARMTERHYAHLAPSYVADTIRANFPKLGIVENPRLSTLRGGGRAIG
jgi:integrase